MQQTNNKVIVSDKAIIVRHQLIYSGKEKKTVVVTQVTSEGLEELIRFREEEKQKIVNKTAEVAGNMLIDVVKKKTFMPWEQERAEQYIQSILN